MPYIFTNGDGTKILRVENNPHMFGASAELIRRDLQKKHKKETVIAWAHMGGYNPKLEINSKSK